MKHNMNMIQSSQRISNQCRRQSSSQWSISNGTEYVDNIVSV